MPALPSTEGEGKHTHTRAQNYNRYTHTYIHTYIQTLESLNHSTRIMLCFISSVEPLADRLWLFAIQMHREREGRSHSEDRRRRLCVCVCVCACVYPCVYIYVCLSIFVRPSFPFLRAIASLSSPPRSLLLQDRQALGFVGAISAQATLSLSVY